MKWYLIMCNLRANFFDLLLWIQEIFCPDISASIAQRFFEIMKKSMHHENHTLSQICG